MDRRVHLICVTKLGVPNSREIIYVFSDLKRSFRSGGPILSLLAIRVEPEYRSVARSIFEGFLKEIPIP
jgi:hypothetical protein